MALANVKNHMLILQKHAAAEGGKIRVADPWLGRANVNDFASQSCLATGSIQSEQSAFLLTARRWFQQ